MMEENDRKEQIKKTLWDFLCAQEKAKTSQTKEDIIFRDLTLCPCIESIYRYYLFCKKIDIATEASRPDSNLDIRVLGAIKNLRDRFLAHNVFSPFRTQKTEEINDIVILRKNDEIDIDLIQKVLLKTACEIFDFKNKAELMKHLQEKHFPVLTDSFLYNRTIDYIVETNKLYEYLENDLGFTRKETRYIFDYLCGGLPGDKDNRNRFLHEQIDANPPGMLAYDPELPQLYRQMIDMLISDGGKEDTVKWIKTWIQQRKKMGDMPPTTTFDETCEACEKYYQAINQATLAAMQTTKKSPIQKRRGGTSR